jgi:hypothetical protein
MNVCHKNKILFVHVPKSAGTSIAKPLGLTPEHLTQDTIIDTQLKGRNISEYYKFCFVRNPWDRFVSLYHYVCDGSEMWNTSSYGKGPHIDFKTFCKVCRNGCIIANHHVWNVHYNPQLSFINVPAWSESSKSIDYIGRFENLQEDLNQICKNAGIKPFQVPHKNKTKHKHYTEYYNNETRQIVAEKYAEDISHFGYKFGK